MMVKNTLDGEFPCEQEARLRATLDCVNNELKQATLLIINRDYQIAEDLRKALSDLTSVALPKRSTFIQYALRVFVPRGFVKIGEVSPNSRRKRNFILSYAGESFGQPIAACFLQYAVDHKISFHNVLGSIQSTGVANAPYIKVRLLEEIANGAKNHRDLSKGAGVSEVLKSQLTTLDSLGLISYTSIPEESANKRIFSWVAEMPFEKVRPVRAYPHLTSQIVDWFKQNRVGNKNTICRDINYDYSANVSRVLTDLTQQGCITSRYPGNTRSNIELLPAGKELWGFFKSVREALSSDDNPQIKAFRDVLNEFKRDNALFERYLIEGIERYIPISQWSTSQPREETEKQILDFVSLYQEKYGFGPRPMEISKSLAIPAVRESFYLIDLANRGSLKRIRKGRESRYSLPMQ